MCLSRYFYKRKVAVVNSCQKPHLAQKNSMPTGCYISHLLARCLRAHKRGSAAKGTSIIRRRGVPVQGLRLWRVRFAMHRARSAHSFLNKE